MRRPVRPHISISKIVAGVVIVVFIIGLLATITLSGNTTTSIGLSDSTGQPVAAGELPAIRLGTPRNVVEQRLGKGISALAYPETGVAVEPMNATCTYYPQDISNLRNVVQLCYRNDKLVAKRGYAATPGAPLQG